MKNTSIVILLAIGIATPLCAAQECTAIADDQARLACFDKASRPQPKDQKHEAFIASAKATLASLLKDPESVRWRNVYAVGVQREEGICGEMMAKNSYGAYTGWKRFVGRVLPTPDIFIDTGDATSKLIIDAAYIGLNAAWGGDGRTVFGTRNSTYEALVPLDGYCLSKAPD